MVARIRDALAFGTERDAPASTPGRDKPVPYGPAPALEATRWTRRRLEATRRGDPCGRPDSRRAGVWDRTRRAVVTPGRDKPVPYGPAPTLEATRWTDGTRGRLETARRGDPCGRPDSRRTGVWDRTRRAVVDSGTGQARPLRLLQGL